MALGVNTNFLSLNAQRNLSIHNRDLATHTERLSSGLRINTAADDAAGLAIMNRLKAQANGLDQGVRNANDGISILRTAEKALQTSTDILLRMRSLAVQSASDANSSSDRQNIQTEIDQLVAELDAIGSNTQFGSRQNLLNGSFVGKAFHTGPYANETVSFTIADSRATSLGSYEVSNEATSVSSMAVSITGTYTSYATALAASNWNTQILTIAGSKGSTTVNVAEDTNANTVVNSVNNVSAATGVTARAITRARIDTVTVAASGTDVFTFKLYGKLDSAGIGVSADIAAAISGADLTELAKAINAKTGTTGIVAELSGNKTSVELVSKDGYNIILENVAGAAGVSSNFFFRGLDQDSAVIAAGAGNNGTNLGTGASTDSAIVGGQVTFMATSGAAITSNASTAFFDDTNAHGTSVSSMSSVLVTTKANAEKALERIDMALKSVDENRASLGAVTNRLEAAVKYLSTTQENVMRAVSTIGDADFAAEVEGFTRKQIQVQAATLMEAQANSTANNALTLLGGL